MNQIKAVIIISLISFICVICTGFILYYKNPNNIYIAKSLNYVKEKAGYKEPVKKWPPPIQVKNYIPNPNLDLSPRPMNFNTEPTVKRYKATPPPVNHKPQIYSWTDEKGIKHYTNVRPDDPRIVERTWNAEVSKPEPIKRYAAQNRNCGTAINGAGSYTPPEPVSSYSEKPENKTGFREISRGIYECDGYTFNISANKNGDMLSIRGRVSDGEYCENLRARITCKNKNGWTEHIETNLTNIGGNRSDLIREDTRIYDWSKNPSEKWEVTDIDVICTAD